MWAPSSSSCPRIIRPAYRAKYTFALFLAAFILIYASDLPPLSRLFSLIISGIGTLSGLLFHQLY